MSYWEVASAASLNLFIMFQKNNKVAPRFAYRSEAFEYCFAELVARGRDMTSAAKEASEFAEIVSTNLQLPAAPPKPMNGIDICLAYAKQISAIKRENPDVWDMITGIASGVIGGFAGGSVVAITEPTTENIDFTNLD